MDPYLTINVLDTFTECLGIRYHHLNVVGPGITVPGAGLGQCVAIFMVIL